MCNLNYRQIPVAHTTAGPLPSAPVGDLLGAKALMVRLGVGRTKFYANLKSGKLPPSVVQLGSRSPRWLWGDVVEFLINQNKQEAGGYE